MRSRMSFRAKRELLLQVSPRYQEASHQQKSIILDEFVAATGYARKYAIRLLAQPVTTAGRRDHAATGTRATAPPCRRRLRSPGRRRTGSAASAWCRSCRSWSPAWSGTAISTLTDEVRAQLLALSPATADRLLRPPRERQRRGV